MNDPILMVIIALVVGAVIGWVFSRWQARTHAKVAGSIVEAARQESHAILREARLQAHDETHKAREQFEQSGQAGDQALPVEVVGDLIVERFKSNYGQAADHHAELDAERGRLRQIGGERLDHRLIDAEALTAGERFAGELDDDASIDRVSHPLRSQSDREPISSDRQRPRLRRRSRFPASRCPRRARSARTR